MVALLIPDIANPFYPVLARGLQDVLRGAEYHAIICNTDAESDQERGFLEDVIRRRVDGVVLEGFRVTHRDAAPLLEAGIPCVSLTPEIAGADFDCVTSDDEAGAAEATAYLVSKGHRGIAMIGGGADTPPARSRFAGYSRALQEAGLPFRPDLVAAGDFTRASGARAMHRLLVGAMKPTAVFCANDLMAIGAFDAARSLGTRIPDDVAVVGYDDVESASLVTPALTTVMNPAYELGATCGRLLIERMSHGHVGPGRKVVVPHRLVIRASA